MLVVRIEIWPFGLKDLKREIGRAEIGNDGTGSPERGNYDARVWSAGNPVAHEIRVEGYPRSVGAWGLLHEVLCGLFPDGFPEEAGEESADD